MKNKKGFTLVEILAVIIILAILVLLAIPAVANLMESSAQNTFKNEVLGIVKTMENAYTEKYGNGDITQDEGHDTKIHTVTKDGKTYSYLCMSLQELNDEQYIKKNLGDNYGGYIEMYVGEDETITNINTTNGKYYMQGEYGSLSASTYEPTKTSNGTESIGCPGEPTSITPTETKVNITFNPNGGIIADSDRVKEVIVGREYGELPNVTNGYNEFSGWFTEQEGGVKVESSSTVNNTESHTLYAHWNESIAKFDDGGVVNGKMKGFAKGLTTGASLYDENTNILSFQRSRDIPSEYKIDAYKVSVDGDGLKPIYMWFESSTGAIKWYSEATKVYLNPIGAWLFYNMKKIETIDTTDLDTSIVTNFWCTFAGDNALKTLDVSKFDTSNVTNMGYMFAWNNSLTTLDVSKFDTKNVELMQYMFEDDFDLTTLDVSGFDTSKVTNMQNTFRNLSSITTLSVGGFNTSKVTTMTGMFEGVKKVTTLDVATKPKVTTLDVSGFNTSKVTNMFGMFRDMYNVTALSVGGFNTSKVTNMWGMFWNVQKVDTIAVSNWNTENVESMGCLFSSMYNLKSLDLRLWKTSKVTNMHSMLAYLTSITSLQINSPTFVTSNVEDMSMMFYHCPLSSLDVSNFNTSKVTNMAVMFGHMKEITTLDIRNFDTRNVTLTSYTPFLDIDPDNVIGMFQEDVKLEKIIVNPDTWDMSKVTDSNRMFAACWKLKGQNGTTYDDNYIDKTYARIDTSSQRGYLSTT